MRIERQGPTPTGQGGVTVAIGAGGICGSDLHHRQKGDIGTIRVREPIIRGRKAAGHVVALGEGVGDLSERDPVAAKPSHPSADCGQTVECLPDQFRQSIGWNWLGRLKDPL
nr:alcohol dehydrogenase catalytic domain-containing protein [Jannaschia sp. S6380]